MASQKPTAHSSSTLTPSEKHTTTIWQWNCRGYRRKRGALMHYIGTKDFAPDIIALQEPNCPPSLSGYTMFMQMDSGPEATLYRAATLVAKHISVINHSFKQHRHIPHTLLEILPKKKTLPSLFVLNVYSSPSQKADDFRALFHDAIQVVQPRTNSLVIVGDFNAAHPTWGYVKENPKGRRLAQAIANNHLTIMTEPEHPTRMGNTVSRDTCPDLTLVRTQTSCSWSNLDETLGSDHYILETEVCDGGRRTRKLRPARLTNWDQFRQQRGSTESGDITSIQEWTQRLHEDIDRATKKVNTTIDTPAIDPHLLHMWDARRGLTKRWKTQRFNRKLRLRIAELNQKAETTQPP